MLLLHVESCRVSMADAMHPSLRHIDLLAAD